MTDHRERISLYVSCPSFSSYSCRSVFLTDGKTSNNTEKKDLKKFKSEAETEDNDGKFMIEMYDLDTTIPKTNRVSR